MVTYQNTNLFLQPTPNCGSSCEKIIGSNVINALKGGFGVSGGGGGWGGVGGWEGAVPPTPQEPQEPKLFC